MAGAPVEQGHRDEFEVCDPFLPGSLGTDAELRRRCNGRASGSGSSGKTGARGRFGGFEVGQCQGRVVLDLKPTTVDVDVDLNNIVAFELVGTAVDGFVCSMISPVPKFREFLDLFDVSQEMM